MKTRAIWLGAVLAVCSSAAGAANTCLVSTSKSTITLQGDCTTDASLVIPDGMTFNLNGHTVTAVDPPGGHFVGGIVQNGGARASVTNGTLRTSGALADVCDAGADRLRGVLFDGASGAITNLRVLDINQNNGATLSGCQEGNAIEVRNFGSSPTTVTVVIDGNIVAGYQKTGIIVNGDSDGTVTNNTVTGAGPQGFIAQNGIQIGFGATAKVKFNTVSGNAYTGNSTVSGGVIVVAGPFYGSDYSVGNQVQNNTLTGNDIGVWLSQIDASGNPPPTQTNAKVDHNTIGNAALTNGLPYQAGVADQGNNDKIINNAISGAGYDPATAPGATFAVDADPSFTNRPKVHANR